MDLHEAPENSQSTILAEQEVFPIYLKNMGSTNGNLLYDIDGDIITDDEGKTVNVRSKGLLEMFESGKLRLIRNMIPGYRYFIKNKQQMDNFMFNRKYGAEYPNLTYCIYEDEDIDKSHRNDHKVVYLSSRHGRHRRRQPRW